MSFKLPSLIATITLLACQQAEAGELLDLLAVGAAEDRITRLYGSAGNGRKGVPVAGGADCDGDGYQDFGMASIQASPLGRAGAGEVYLVFGDGTIGGSLDTAGFDPNILKIAGDGVNEVTGAEIWIDDVTGDGMGDLIIGRQNFTPEPGRPGAGALTIIFGGPALRDLAALQQYYDLRNIPLSDPNVTTIIGASDYDRLGIWMRTGDVDNDGIADIVVGSDEVDLNVNDLDENSGMVYVIRGGPHLVQATRIDLNQYGQTSLRGNIARFHAPAGTSDYHLGSTVQVADLDGNGRAEVLASAALNRSGATIDLSTAPLGSSEGRGGTFDGSCFIAWDDNFPAAPWPAGYTFDIMDPNIGSSTRLDGNPPINISFGEEIVGGLDCDGDGQAELIVGDIVGLNRTNTSQAGNVTVFYNASLLKGRTINLDNLPQDVVTTQIWGMEFGAITGDTMILEDFTGDGLGDLVIGSPGQTTQGRIQAGVVHVIYGKVGGWGAEVDLAVGQNPPKEQVRLKQIDGATGGNTFADIGDMLCYSISAGDLNGDGRIDLLVNEMAGNGLAPNTLDVGNCLVVNGKFLGQIDDADIDGSGQVNTIDLSLLGNQWQDTDCGVCERADVTGDGDVTFPDLQALATAWLIRR